MELSGLTIEHFRNIRKTDLHFSPGINVFLGKNGQGKTNLLEAVSALSLSRPFRSREKEVFVQEGSPHATITGAAKAEDGSEETLRIFWELGPVPGGRTVFFRNDVEFTATEYLRTKGFAAVLFSPEDMVLTSAPPKMRRNYLSQVLSPLIPEYLKALLEYERVLKQRNRLLIECGANKVRPEEFHFWDTALVKNGEIIMEKRKEFFSSVAPRFPRFYHALSRKKESVEIRYLPSIPPPEDFASLLGRSFQNDVRLGSTQKGPHRDDFEILCRGKPLSETASRGEVRTAMIALKLSEREFITGKTGKNPVLLLDDVFSELDEDRSGALMDLLQKSQIFLTGTHVPEGGLLRRIFSVNKGKIREIRSSPVQKKRS